MGIRYYAYAFDAELTQQAVDDPESILSDDPLADAWGMEPHASVSVATLEQVSPKSDMLYLDKAWSALQGLTRPRLGWPGGLCALRMFEGHVTMHDVGWDPWIRTILPEEVPAISEDLCTIDEEQVRAWFAASPGHLGGDDEGEIRYVLDFLERAQQFTRALAADGRGMVYMIG